MIGPIFDFEDGDFIFQSGDNMGFDSQGHIHMRVGDNMSIDMESGQMHMTSSWRNNSSIWDDEDED